MHTQVAKLLIIPFVCMVERCWLGRTFTRPVILSMLVVVAGVAIVYALIIHASELWLLPRSGMRVCCSASFDDFTAIISLVAGCLCRRLLLFYLL